MQPLFAEARLTYRQLDALPEHVKVAPAAAPADAVPVKPEETPKALSALQGEMNQKLLIAADIRPTALPTADTPTESANMAQ